MMGQLLAQYFIPKRRLCPIVGPTKRKNSDALRVKPLKYKRVATATITSGRSLETPQQ